MTPETCANCGHDITEHNFSWKGVYGELNGNICKKFIPQTSTVTNTVTNTVTKHQNHSPQTNTRKVIVSGDKTEDKEPVEIKTETQVVNDRLNSSGSDNQNHSPQKIRQSIDHGENCPRSDEENESEVTLRYSSGSDDICSCGHFFSIHHAGTDFSCWNTHCKCKQFKPRNDVCKEVNKIEKNFNNKINKLKKEHGKD